MDQAKQALLRNLPKIDEMMLRLEAMNALENISKDIAKTVCRLVVEDMRKTILEKDDDTKIPTMDKVLDRTVAALADFYHYRLRRVVNATGIIIHTNLGRAPLCREAVERIAAVSIGYSNLEYDLSEGKRGSRYDHVRNILCALSGAEDAVVVNNNAAAVLLCLNTLASGKEAVVSRGELVEIGGEFRIPEVMEKSGARLKEVGATNRTRLVDYERAIGPDTGLILKVHTSNFRIVGFTEETELDALVTLGKKHGIPVMHDLGSGCFIELDRFGLEREPTVKDVVANKVDVITFSGDKLLGGPQAGIILGRKSVLAQIKKNPLNRALRIDKLTLAALEATMMHYLKPDNAVKSLRVLNALTEPLDQVRKRARRLFSALSRAKIPGIHFSVRMGTSLAGGGSLPTREIPSVLIAVQSDRYSPSAFEVRLRKLDIPIIARIAADEILFDLRTITDEEIHIIRDGLKSIATA
jgi:L-seryl-tRNA(Ser) seleniumtransferase